MNKTGQSALEYALIVAVIIGGLLAIQKYMKRGVEGSLRTSADSLGEQFSAGHTSWTLKTNQKEVQRTVETFGLDMSANLDDGVTTSVNSTIGGVASIVISASPIEVKATAGDKETINVTWSNEGIFETNWSTLDP